jgi:glyoxylase-like metal-dependent hydrolase (beta-lactamase superfamily II)
LDELNYKALDFGITCVDASYVQPGMACLYLLEEAGEYAVVETGTSKSVQLLTRLLDERNIEPEQIRYVIPTHVHLDHAGGAGALMAIFPGAQLLIHPRGARHMADPSRLVAGATAVYGEAMFRELYGEIRPIAPGRIRQMEDGETVSIAGRTLEFRHTRGHAEHHFCIWDERSQGWFSGDMFGVSYPWCRFPSGDFVMPSTTPSQFDPEAYLVSLDLLDSYGPQRVFLTHFSEMAYTREKSRLLAQQIEAYCEIAMSNAGESSLLERRLNEYALELLHQLGAPMADTVLLQRIKFDMQLNAMGLQMWRDTKERDQSG